MKLRLWKLGSLEHKIYPGSATITKLSEILLNTDYSERERDIIWGPDLLYKSMPLEIQEDEADENDINVIVDTYYHSEEFEQDLLEFITKWKPKDPA